MTELSPIETSCKTTLDLIVTFFPSLIWPSNITFTSMLQSLPALTSPRRSTREASINDIPWANNNNLRISIERKIRDYQGNKMESPIDLIYSTTSDLNYGQISGNISNYNPDIIPIVRP